MSLSNELISKFVKITNDSKKDSKETTVYGTVKIDGKSKTVTLDGSETRIPISDKSTATVANGDRVTVLIKNHTAIVTGNLKDPAGSSADVGTLGTLIYGFNDRIVTCELICTELKAKAITTDTLEAEVAKIEVALIGRVETELINAERARIDTLEADVGRIDSVIFEGAAGDTIHTNFSNAVVAQIGDAQIKSAMIESVSAGKITAGKINTDQVFIGSTDETLLIQGNLIQLKEGDDPRIQIGKDSLGNYTILICDENGNTMLAADGLHKDAIKEAIIVDTMINESADISATKLNIDSLFNVINSDESHTIKSSQILLDDEGQSLTVAFKALSDNVHSQGTVLEAVQGSINSKVWEQDIAEATGAMSTQYSELSQQVDGVTSTVSSHESTLSSIDTRITIVEQTASDVSIRLDGQVIGGTNILRGTNSITTLGSSSAWTNSTWRNSGGGTGTRSIIAVSDTPNANVKIGVKIVGDSTDTSIAQNNVPVLVGKEYTMSCYARGTGILRMQVGTDPYSSSAHTIDEYNGYTWMRYSYTFTAGTNNGVTDGKTNIYFGNRGNGALEICGFKLELGNTATDWSASPYDVDDGIVDASKTATNYLNYSGTGLIVGDMTASVLGSNVLIDSDSVDVRKGSKVLASFGADLIELGKAAAEATISFCGGNVTLVATKDGSGQYDGIRFDSTNFRVVDEGTSIISNMRGTTKKYNRFLMTTNATENYLTNSWSSLITDGSSQYNAFMGTHSDGASKTANSSMSAEHYNGTTWKKNYLEVTPTKTTLSDGSNSGTIRPWNKVLWKGPNAMNGSATATLSENVSAQPSGIVLVFSRREDGAAQDVEFTTHFVPKYQVATHPGTGYDFNMASSTCSLFATKYLYISDGKVVGHDNNTASGTGASGIKYSNGDYTLRYIIGV